MPKYIEMPDGKVVEFPDNMSDDQITATLEPKQKETSVFDKLTSMRRKAGLGPTTVETIWNAAQNIPESAGQFVSNLVHPIYNEAGFGPDAYVNFQNQLGQTFSDPAKRQAVVDMYVNRFANPSETFQKDPVGFAADLSAVGGIAGLGARLPGAAGGIARGASIAGQAVDPIGMAGRAASGAAKFTGEKVIAPAVGRLVGYTTESPKVAFKGGQVFRDWMRGDGESTEILAKARGAIDDMADSRRAEYQNGMQQLTQASKGRTVDIVPVKSEFNSRLKQFQIVVDPETGALDFSRVKGLTPALKEDITAIKNMLDDWGNKTDDFSVNGMDTLKQNLDNHFSAIGMNDRIDAFLKPVKNKLIEQIEKTAPGYNDILSKYGQEIELQKIIEKAFSTKDPRTTETAIRKVEQALQDNNSYRTKLVEMMDSKTGSELKEMIAGMNMRGMWPRSWLGASSDMATLGMVAGGVISPKFLAVLAISSPRLVGEFSNMVGRIYGMSSSARNLAPRGVASRPAFQAGRATQMTEQEF